MAHLALATAPLLLPVALQSSVLPLYLYPSLACLEVTSLDLLFYTVPMCLLSLRGAVLLPQLLGLLMLLLLLLTCTVLLIGRVLCCCYNAALHTVPS